MVEARTIVPVSHALESGTRDTSLEKRDNKRARVGTDAPQSLTEQTVVSGTRSGTPPGQSYPEAQCCRDAGRDSAPARKSGRLTHPGNGQRRGLTLAEAAQHAGVSQSAFRDWVRKGKVPGSWPGTRRYDRWALDMALDRMSGLKTAPSSAYQDWKVRRAATRAT